MTPDRQHQVERICQEALDRHGPERSEYLASACRDDEGLRQEVESLLAYEQASERFIEAPAIDHAARELATTETLQVGARLGSYEVVSPLGSGGMGDVYRARDTKLQRDVAIKVLPALFLADRARRARFEQEARMLAALNHPRIAAIYGADDSTGMPALILELVDGETLAALLARSGRTRPMGLPLQKALDIARQIAEGLEAAHEKGIIHRDLKPSNVKITPDGAVKVLDFGVATVLVQDNAERQPETEWSDSHSAEVIVGTAAYMSPEQAQGLPIDKRTDIWAFGCVLFEMLSGKRAFEGDSGSVTLASVLTREPDWATLPRQTPPSISWLLRRCVQKDRKRRLADIADARLEIEEALSMPIDTAPRQEHIRPARVWLPWLIAATCVVAWAVALGFWFRTDPQRPQLVQFPITATAMAEPFFLSVSPDGNQIVYPVTTAAGTVLWIRRLDSPDARVLQGTEGGAVSDWSPDSRFIVFASGGHLKKIDVNGGPPQTLTTHRSPFRRSTWSRNGVILFTDGPIIRRIADTGGEASNVTELDPSRNETAHSTPWFLPDGRHFFYTAWSDNPEDRAIYVGSLDSKERIRLLSADSKAIYSPPGLILFRRERQLMVQHFDPNLLQLRGDAVPIVSSISFSPDLGQSAFHVSERALVYVADTTSGLNLMWFDRAGTMSEPRRVVPGLNPALSPDDRRVAFYAGAGTTNVDIWTYDFDRDLIERLTTDPDGDAFPLFSPDGQRLVFASNRDNPTMVGLYEKPSNGAAAEQNILPPVTRVMMPRDWTDGGEQLILETGLRFTDPRDILVLSRGSNSKPVPYAATSYDERHPALSPDNKWLAYTTNESDTYQIVVQAFPDPTDGKVPVGPGRFPRWKAKGGELYYINADGWLVAATVRTTPTFEVLRTTPLFSAPFNPQLTDLNIPYDVTADGKRFLMSVPVTPLANPRETVINVVLGWQALLPNGFNSD